MSPPTKKRRTTTGSAGTCSNVKVKSKGKGKGKEKDTAKDKGGSKAKSKISKNQTKSSLGNSNKSENVLIVIENHMESMDVTLTAQVFEKLGLSVSYVARFQNRPFHLLQSGTATTQNVSMRADTTFFSALKVPWKLIVLPGGNDAMPLLLAQKSFVALLANHIKKRNGLVAAMGSSATQILPYLGYVDKLGPICYPLLGGTKVVLQEGNHIWAAPGQGTATELALALGEHWFGQTSAQRVANSLGYVPAPWHIDNLKQERTSCPNMWASHEDGDKDNHRIEVMHATFWEIVWPQLRDLGWGSDFETRNSWIFWRCGFDDCLQANTKRIQGKDWFDSPQALLEYLNQEFDSSFVQIMRQFHEKVSLATAKNLSAATTGDDSSELFQHVVWRRLEPLGWQTKESGIYCTPPQHRPMAEFTSTDCVLRYLLSDPLFCTDPQYLSIVDLYRNCKQTSQSLALGKKSPVVIEAITKERVPALATY